MVDRFPVLWNSWQWFLHDEWKRQTEMMRAYIETTEEAYGRQLEAVRNEPRPPEPATHEQDIDSECDDQPDWFDEQQYLKIKALHDDFPVLVRHMAFCAMIGYFEHELYHVCDSLKWFRKLGKDVRDNKKDKGIIAAKRYLINVAQVPLPAESPEWTKIFSYNRIRNLIMHNDSRVTANKSTEFAAAVKQTGPIEVDVLRRLKLSKEYCLAAIETIETFFDGLAKLLPSETEEDRKEGLDKLIKALRDAGYPEKGGTWPKA